jgi:hypothetical protein
MDTLAGGDYAASWTTEGTSGEQTVTEAEWMNCTKPAEMRAFLRGRASERKARLFAVACCRRIWYLLEDERSRMAVAVAERFADGLATASEVGAARRDADDAYRYRDPASPHDSAAYAAVSVCLKEARLAAEFAAVYTGYAVGDHAVRLGGTSQIIFRGKHEAQTAENIASCSLLREFFGNPFHPVSIPSAVLAWNDSTVVRLAQAAYQERHLPAGTLDSGRLAVLADALEEAGCTDADVVGHLRGPGPHVRGCWVVDLCLGKA